MLTDDHDVDKGSERGYHRCH